MKLIQSLEEIREYGRRLAALPTKAVRAIPDDEILNFYIAANKFVPELLLHYARLYDFPDYKKGTVHFLRRCSGLCSYDNHIDIDFLVVLFADDVRFRAILLHELCHTKYHNHKVPFWELLDAKLKEASIIYKNDDSRKNWLKKPWFKDDDGHYLYDEPGDIYENVSLHKLKVIRDKVCYSFSCNRRWMTRGDQLVLSDIYRLIYNMNNDADEIKYLPEIIGNILTGNCKLLTTFDYMDAINFFKGKNVVKTYTGYGRGAAKVNDAFHEIFEKIGHNTFREEFPREANVSALFVFSANTSSSIPISDLGRILDDKYLSELTYTAVFVEDPNVGIDEFCIHMILAENRYSDNAR